MSSNLAAKLCPLGIFLKPQFEKYKKVSQQILEIFNKFTPLVEMVSLDEAYLDVSHSQHFNGSAIFIYCLFYIFETYRNNCFFCLNLSCLKQ